MISRVVTVASLSLLLIVATAIQSVAAAGKPLIEITDSHGKYRFQEPPARFVSLNWALTEQLLELEEVPLGVAELKQFETISTKYNLGQDVVDLGPRLSPDLDAIRQLKPEVIFIGYSQRSLLRPLSNIATVIYFKNFGRRYDNAAKSEDRFLELAKLFRKTELANQKIDSRNDRLDSLRSNMDGLAAEAALPELLLLAPGKQKNSQYVVFGKNSLPYAAATRVGVTAVSPEKTDAFGVAQISLKELIELKQASGNKVCLVVFNQYAAGGDTQGLAALGEMDQQGCQFNLKYQQAFGGVMSIQWLAEELVINLKRHMSTK